MNSKSENKSRPKRYKEEVKARQYLQFLSLKAYYVGRVYLREFDVDPFLDFNIYQKQHERDRIFDFIKYTINGCIGDLYIYENSGLNSQLSGMKSANQIFKKALHATDQLPVETREQLFRLKYKFPPPNTEMNFDRAFVDTLELLEYLHKCTKELASIESQSGRPEDFPKAILIKNLAKLYFLWTKKDLRKNFSLSGGKNPITNQDEKIFDNVEMNFIYGVAKSINPEISVSNIKSVLQSEDLKKVQSKNPRLIEPEFLDNVSFDPEQKM